jgi:hypothetical protein
MMINELATDPNAARLLALSQFLIGRAADTDAAMSISTGSFLNLASNMGISLTVDQLKDLSQQLPLKNVIANVEGDAVTGKVLFKGSDDEGSAQMSVDQARNTVDSMAKRAAQQGLKKPNI